MEFFYIHSAIVTSSHKLCGYFFSLSPPPCHACAYPHTPTYVCTEIQDPKLQVIGKWYEMWYLHTFDVCDISLHVCYAVYCGWMILTVLRIIVPSSYKSWAVLEKWLLTIKVVKSCINLWSIIIYSCKQYDQLHLSPAWYSVN